jgi:hypothetical protein
MLGEALAAIALLHQLFCVLLGPRPVETMAEGLGHQGSGRCVMPSLPLMYLSQQLYPFLWANEWANESQMSLCGVGPSPSRTTSARLAIVAPMPSILI